jgi:hypothetical protein
MCTHHGPLSRQRLADLPMTPRRRPAGRTLGPISPISGTGGGEQSGAERRTRWETALSELDALED